MGFQVSPGVVVSEIDATTVVPAVSTTEGGLAGLFHWGPVDKITLINSENSLVSRFGKPSNYNPETFFTAANFLSYSNKLYVVRVANTSQTLSAVANSGAIANLSAQVVKNQDELANVTFDANTNFVAKYPGSYGNSLKISVVDSANAYTTTFSLISNSSVNATSNSTYLNFAVGSNTATLKITADAGATANAIAGQFLNQIQVSDVLEVGDSTTGKQYIKISAIGSQSVTQVGAEFVATANISLAQPVRLSSNVSTQAPVKYWEYFRNVDKVPGTSAFVSSLGLSTKDQLHVVVVDENGVFTGTPGTILETFEGLSRATDAKNETGGTNYYKTVINNSSNYIWVANDRAGAASALATSLSNSTNITALTQSFVSGADGANEGAVSTAVLAKGYDKFINAEQVDVSLVLAGKSRDTTLANYIVGNICEVRKDCVAFISPEYSDVVSTADPLSNVIDFRNNLNIASSYAVMDSGYKYQYDKYNDVYRYIPLNGDTAGLTARTDDVRDPWFSPAGLSRGQIKNAVKLAWNPSKADRDQLYKNDINPVISLPNQGVVLFGDKTLLGRSSAFSQIGVRRLFITVEKAIANVSKSILFEFNDEVTRAQFINLINPYLRDIQGRRGIIDFYVEADERVNTPEVVDSERFVGNIFIKPARSINYIQLNFVAVRSGVEFQEIVSTGF